MSVFERITREIHSGMVLYTPVRRARFTIDSVDTEKVVFFVGTKTRIKIPRACWDGIPNFLRGKDWVKIGAKHARALRNQEEILFRKAEFSPQVDGQNSKEESGNPFKQFL